MLLADRCIAQGVTVNVEKVLRLALLHDWADEPATGAALLATAPDQVARLGSRGFVQIGQVR